LKSKIIYLLICVFLIKGSASLHAQIVTGQTKVDSVLAALKNSKEDTSKVKAMNALVLQLVYTGGYRLSDSLALEELRLASNLNYKLGIANSYNNMGVIFNYQSDFSHSLEYLLKSLKIYEALNYRDGMGISYKYIGAVYVHEGDTANALDYFHRALRIFYELKDTNYIASALISIGNLYGAAGQNGMALQALRRSLQFFSEINNKDGVASAIMYIGDIFQHEKRYDSAMSYLLHGKTIFEGLKDNDGISRSLNLMATVYVAKNKYKEALDCANKGLGLAKQIGSLDIAMTAQKTLSDIYIKKKDGANALLHYKAYVILRDSVFNQQNTLKTFGAQMSYTNEKRDAARKAEDDKKEALHKEEVKRNQTIITAVTGILLVLIVFSIFVYMANVQRKKDNKIIEQKNYQITQSINYAERIQRSMLPGKEDVQSLFPQSFILFKPKDIVSGDFYLLRRKAEKIILAVADCTGHGVPGGFMSMLCSEKLNDSIDQTQNTGEILKHLNQGVKASLHQSESEDSTYDGMDIGLCVIVPSLNGMKLNFSGAIRPLWIIRQGASDVEEIKPTPRTIGGFTPVDQDYGTYIIQLQKGDAFYMFTDGYTDQFGGDAGKKLGLKRFKSLLLSLQDKPMHEQEKKLAGYVENWKKATPQLDDMLVVGVRV
jgi:serine phosphatase RsbU (regulator of sigma subunit)